MDERHRDLSVRWFDELWNQKRIAVIDELASPDLVAEVEGVEGQMGREEMKDYARAVLTAIEDLQVEVTATSVDPPKVVLDWRAVGTHTGPGFGVAPSGQQVHFNGLTWFEWRDGLLVRGIDRWNRGEVIAGLMQVQLRELEEKFGLTARQAEVSLMMAERRTHKEIAKRLGIRPNTARRHCEAVLRKLGLNRREDVAGALGISPGTALPKHAADVALELRG